MASLLLAVTLLDTWILYTQTNRQTRQSGAYQLEAMSGKLESTISDAKDLTMSLAIKAREYLGDKSALERFIYAEKDEILTKDTGAFNLYIAGEGFYIIPGLGSPNAFVFSSMTIGLYIITPLSFQLITARISLTHTRIIYCCNTNILQHTIMISIYFIKLIYLLYMILMENILRTKSFW